MNIWQCQAPKGQPRPAESFGSCAEGQLPSAKKKRRSDREHLKDCAAEGTLVPYLLPVYPVLCPQRQPAKKQANRPDVTHPTPSGAEKNKATLLVVGGYKAIQVITNTSEGSRWEGTARGQPKAPTEPSEKSPVALTLNPKP